MSSFFPFLCLVAVVLAAPTHFIIPDAVMSHEELHKPFQEQHSDDNGSLRSNLRIKRGCRRWQESQLQPQRDEEPQPPPRDLQSITTTCELNSDGNYGVLAGTSPTYPSYYYQVVVTNGTSQSDVLDAIVPPLRLSIMNGILNDLFICPSFVPMTEILGISSAFEDRVSSLPCLVDKNDDEECFTFQGRPVLWSAASINTTTAQTILRPLVHSFVYFNANELIALDNRTIQIDYMEEENGQLFRPPPLIDTSLPTTKSPSFPSPTASPVLSPSLAPAMIQTTRPETSTPTITATKAFSPQSAPALSLAPSYSVTPSLSPNLDRKDELPTTAPATNNDRSGDDDDGSYAWWLWAVIGGGALVLVLCGTFLLCRCRNNNSGAVITPGQEMDDSAIVVERSSSRRSVRIGRGQSSKAKIKMTEPEPQDAEYVPPGVDVYPESAPGNTFSVDDNQELDQTGNGLGMAHTVLSVESESGNFNGIVATQQRGAYYEGQDTSEIRNEEDAEVDYEYGQGIILDNMQGEMIGDYIDDDNDDDIVGDIDRNIEEDEADGDGGEVYEDGEDEEYEEGEDEEYEEGEGMVYEDGEDEEYAEGEDEVYAEGEDEEYVEGEDEEYEDGDEDEDDEDADIVEYQHESNAAGTSHRDDSGFEGGDYIDGGFDGRDPSEEEEEEEENTEEEDEIIEEFIDETIHEETVREERTLPY